MRALLSLGWASRVTRSRDSSRSTAVVIAPLVSSTRRPISFTGCGPLWRSISRTAKSERPTSDDSMLRVARRASVRCAFISTSHRWVPEPSAVRFLGAARFMVRKYLNVKILDVKSKAVQRIAGAHHLIHRYSDDSCGLRSRRSCTWRRLEHESVDVH